MLASLVEGLDLVLGMGVGAGGGVNADEAVSSFLQTLT